MLIQKRNGLYQDYDRHKIKNAIIKAFKGIHETINQQHLENILNDVENQIQEKTSVEYIQDIVEEALMRHGYLQVAKAYILYREKHHHLRIVIDELMQMLSDDSIESLLIKIQKDYPQTEYSLQLLLIKLKTFYKVGMSQHDAFKMLMKASVELISKDAPEW